MSFAAIAALLRRNWAAVLIVLVAAAGAGYHIEHLPPGYAESATVVFTAGRALRGANPVSSYSPSLIATETMLAEALTSQSARSQVRAHGGTGQFTLAPFNLYNMQYPDYAEPYATLTTAATAHAAAARTFTAVTRLLVARLAAVQAQVDVPARSRIRVYLAGQTGVVAQPGSRAREYGGLALITVVSVFSVAGFCERRRGRRLV